MALLIYTFVCFFFGSTKPLITISDDLWVSDLVFQTKIYSFSLSDNFVIFYYSDLYIFINLKN